MLRNAHSANGARAIVNELGFASVPLALDQASRASLGLPASSVSALITSRSDCLRALIVEVSGGEALRDNLTITACALSRSAPQFLWIVIAVRSVSNEFSISCWSSAGSRVRLASLVCRTDKLYASDAETLGALASVPDEEDLLRHARWLDVLGREAITRRFFSTLQRAVTELSAPIRGRAAASERRDLGPLYISRLIFLAFLETKGWLDEDFGFLSNGYA